MELYTTGREAAIQEHICSTFERGLIECKNSQGTSKGKGQIAVKYDTTKRIYDQLLGSNNEYYRDFYMNLK